MNKGSLFKSLLTTLFVDGLGWMILIAPWAAIYATGTYQEVATWTTYIAYGGIALYGLFYLVGSIRCLDEVAYAIIKDLQDNNQWFTYIPVITIIACSSVAAYKSFHEIALLLITPPMIVWLSRIILRTKANKVTNGT